MLKKRITVNIIISVLVFLFIIDSFIGKPGGDMVIGAFNIIFGLFQLILNIIIYLKKDKQTVLYVLLVIVVLQAIQMIILIKWGHDIRNHLIPSKI